MDAGIYILGGIILLFSLVFGMFDANLNNTMKQDLYESVRAANQNALIALEQDYKNSISLTTAGMIESWLAEFALNNALDYETLRISFVQVETEPPLYLMYVEGFKDEYVVVSGDAYAAFYSGTTIITK